jgi:type II secretory pathway pseudopilin PulG
MTEGYHSPQFPPPQPPYPPPPYYPPPAYPPQPPAKPSRGVTCLIVGIVAFALVAGLAMVIVTGLPTFLGARKRAQDRAAMENLRNALTVEKVIYVDDQRYTTDTAKLAEVEGALEWGAFGGRRQIQVAVGDDGQTVCMATKSESGTTFLIADVVVVDKDSGKQSFKTTQYYSRDDQGSPFDGDCSKSRLENDRDWIPEPIGANPRATPRGWRSPDRR